MLAATGLNPQTVPITSLCNFVEQGPYIALAQTLVFNPEHATEASTTGDQSWWDQEVDD